MPQTVRGRLSIGTKGLQTEIPLTKADRNTASGLPGLAHFASPLEPLEGTLSDVPSVRRGENTAGEAGPAMIFRTPAPSVGKTLPSQEQEGESVLAAQAAEPDRVRAMNRAFSYTAPAAAARAEPASGAQPEQPVTAAGQETSDINYNRLTEELLVRIERRLRAERRKFGL